MSRFLAIVAIVALLLPAACRSTDPTPDPKRNLVSPPQPPASPRATTRPTWTSYPEAGNVQAMALDLDGDLWTGGDGGVTKLDPATGDDTQYTADDGLAQASVSSIALAPDGALWFGTRGGGVSRFDGETWQTYTTADGLAHDWVYDIGLTPDGALWFGTDRGVSRLVTDPDSSAQVGSWTTYTEEDGLLGWSVLSIAVAPDGNLWFGTHIGVSHLAYSGAGESQTWTTYNAMEGWGGPRVEAIFVAPDGTPWFGTRDGVFHLIYPGESPPADPQAGTWTQYSQADGQPLSDVWAIATAPDGALWFGTLDGAFRLQAGSETPTWTAYTSADGLAHDWVEAIVTGPDDALWFGTHGGVSRYVPSD